VAQWRIPSSEYPGKANELSDAEFASKEKLARRERFLAEI
jgi:hypothetical protein